MKAWRVTDLERDWENTDVVHAPTRGLAKTKSWLMIDAGLGFLEVRAVREPLLDDKPLSVENMVAAGFIYRCHSCGRDVWETADAIVDGQKVFHPKCAAHRGDPCQFCGVLHDEVKSGPCAERMHGRSAVR